MRKSSVRSNAGQLSVHEAPRRLGIPAIQLGLDACQHMAVVLAVKPLVRPALHRLVRVPLSLVGLVGGEPDEVHARAQLGFEIAVPAILAAVSRAGSRRETSRISP